MKYRIILSTHPHDDTYFYIQYKKYLRWITYPLHPDGRFTTESGAEEGVKRLKRANIKRTEKVVKICK